MGPINEEQWKWLAKIEANTQKLVDLVNDFLDFSKIEAGHIELVKEEVNLDKIVRLCKELRRPCSLPNQGRSPASGPGVQQSHK